MTHHQNRRLSTTILTFILILVPSLMFADGGPTPSSIFTANPGDQSWLALQYIFGGNQAIQHIMEDFNLGMLTLIGV